MATTSIHAITQTVGASISYIMRDKTEDLLRDDVAETTRYTVDEQTQTATYHTLTTTQNCTSFDDPAKTFHAYMAAYGREEVEHGNARTKTGAPILAWHLIQSFDEEVDPVMANEIGRKMAAEVFPGHPVVISTHTNTEHTHNHIMVCAWNDDGKKWHQCNKNYRRIREYSDRLCDEYGLGVLDHTRKQKLIRWQDGTGKTRYFEPTERKIELIRQRENEEISPDGVGSYRNTLAYQVSELKKEANVAVVKQAIDDLLPHAVSFDHLLLMLRDQGFEIRDKKKNGEWMAHITYTPPTASRGVRDYTIDRETGYYTRESLTAVIEQRQAERRHGADLRPQQQIQHYDEYVYGRIDVQAINEDYRADRAGDGSLQIVQRGEAEKTIIRDVKAADMELASRFDLGRLQELAAEQERDKRYNRSPRSHDEALVRQIQEGFENLRFMERKQMYSYEQISEMAKGLRGQFDACAAQLPEIEGMIQKLEDLAKVPEAMQKVMRRLEKGAGDPAYIMEQYQKDAKLVQTYRAAIQRNKLDDPAGMQALRDLIAKYREKATAVRSKMDQLAPELAGYNRCIFTLDRIARATGAEERTVVRQMPTESRQTAQKRHVTVEEVKAMVEAERADKAASEGRQEPQRRSKSKENNER